jgi:hypothetical protein
MKIDSRQHILIKDCQLIYVSYIQSVHDRIRSGHLWTLCHHILSLLPCIHLYVMVYNGTRKSTQLGIWRRQIPLHFLYNFAVPFLSFTTFIHLPEFTELCLTMGPLTCFLLPTTLFLHFSNNKPQLRLPV